jgi:hypothetical protein
MHLRVVEFVADVGQPFSRRQLTGALSIRSDTSTPTTRPGAAARAASRVVNLVIAQPTVAPNDRACDRA